MHAWLADLRYGTPEIRAVLSPKLPGSEAAFLNSRGINEFIDILLHKIKHNSEEPTPSKLEVIYIQSRKVQGKPHKTINTLR